MTEICAIAALGRGGVIGNKNDLPWHLPADLKHFKQVTMGCPIIMGRKNHESIGRALPGRMNIIISRQDSYEAEDCIVVKSTEEALSKAANAERVFVIGGSEIYKLFLPVVERLYLTRIDADFNGDTFFPEIDQNSWNVTSQRSYDADKDNPYAYTFVQLSRKTR